MLTQTLAIALAVAASTSAQSTVTKTLLLPDLGPITPTITAIASSGETTTYTISCSNPITSAIDAFNSGLSAGQSAASSLRSQGDALISSARSQGAAILSSADANGDRILSSLAGRGSSLLNDLTARAPAPTAAPHLFRRQNDEDGDDDENDFDVFDDVDMCLPIRIIQGPSTYEMHLTVSDRVTADVKCAYTGSLGANPVTCLQSGTGDVFGVGVGTSATTTMAATEIRDNVKTTGVILGTAGAQQSGTNTNSASGAQDTGAAGMVGVGREVGGLMAAAGAILGAALAL